MVPLAPLQSTERNGVCLGPKKLVYGARGNQGTGEAEVHGHGGVKRRSDASLGCPKEGMAFAQVLSSGYKLIFDLAGMPYAVHSNSDGSHMVICGDGQ